MTEAGPMALEPDAPPPQPAVPPPDGTPTEAPQGALAAPPAPTPAAAVARIYDLPSARNVVISGLLLAASSTRELRRASLYIGLLTLGLLGPTVAFGLLIATHLDLRDLDLLVLLRANSDLVDPFVIFLFLVYGGVFGLVAVLIDGQLIAVSLLAARAGDRTLTLRQATTRARQVFWRLFGGAVVVGLGSSVLQTVIRFALGDPRGEHQGVTIVALVLGVMIFSPFGYLATGVVLGDVGPIEALRRSVALARARPSIALVVALFTLLTAAIQTFALSAGLGLVVDIGQFLHLDLGGSSLAFLVMVIGLLAFVMALGSLFFTISAIVVAPQVAAFLGLTFYSGGLERAQAAGSSRFRWVTVPMAGLMIILAIGAALGASSL